ncbi:MULTISPECIES: SDR family oxidoreductase [Mycobacteriaceae]|uniref:SDR family oxidoreductase n=1 Tax=Mycobacteriaceae TaxID=1762 RepID=UPI0002D6FE4C|nr:MULTISPECIES: SDR family oxidoreductase [Mycobacteriaceae]AMO04228.1 short-chain dehydrogenase [Mycolicibacterium neoaurum]AXK77490.1 SDR family NAD(P)-dependent oxidoreductase [Mycolicibacterium neoaurum]KUM08715.1 short-chain dehydrogenase [Mycolicibacterium neoaurum]
MTQYEKQEAACGTESRRRVALVTGASRGIGAQVARELGARGLHVVINYREKAKRAWAVVDEIRAAGGHATAIGADVCENTQVQALLATINHRFGVLDVLVLNASGGLERGADSGYAMRLNRDAQCELVTRALPQMPAGARIVFVTSHQAHFSPGRPVPAGYEPIAASKRAGEDALLAVKPALAERGIALKVVSGDMIDGTIIVRLLHRKDPAAVEARRDHGPLPTVEEFATAIADAALQPDVADTTFVGGADYRW